MGMCAFLEYFHGVVGVTVENAFTGGCTFLEYNYGWVGVFVTVKDNLCMVVLFLNLFMGGCRCF